MKQKSYTNPTWNPTWELRVKETKRGRDEERGLPQPLPKGKGFVAALMHRTWGSFFGDQRNEETKSQKVKETKRLREEEWEGGRERKIRGRLGKTRGRQRKTRGRLRETMGRLREIRGRLREIRGRKSEI